MQSERPSDEQGTPELGSLRGRLLQRRTLVSFGLSLALLVFFVLQVRIDIPATLRQIAQANLVLFAIALGVYYLALWLRSVRWQLLLQHAGFAQEPLTTLPPLRDLYEILFLGWFVNCIVPAKLGDGYRAYLLHNTSGASPSRTLGTLLGERVADSIMVLVLLGLSGMATYRSLAGANPTVDTITTTGGLLAGGLLLLLLLFLLGGEHLVRRLPQRLRGVAERFQQGLATTFQLGIQRRLYGLTFLIWLCEVGRFWLVMQSLHITALAVPLIAFTTMTSVVLTAIPLTPGGLGAVEGAVIVLLTTLNLTTNVASSLILLDRVISFWSNIVVGVPVYVLSKKTK